MYSEACKKGDHNHCPLYINAVGEACTHPYHSDPVLRRLHRAHRIVRAHEIARPRQGLTDRKPIGGFPRSRIKKNRKEVLGEQAKSR